MYVDIFKQNAKPIIMEIAKKHFENFPRQIPGNSPNFSGEFPLAEFESTERRGLKHEAKLMTSYVPIC